MVDGRPRRSLEFFDESAAAIGAVDRILGGSNPDPDEAIASVAPVG